MSSYRLAYIGDVAVFLDLDPPFNPSEGCFIKNESGRIDAVLGQIPGIFQGHQAGRGYIHSSSGNENISSARLCKFIHITIDQRNFNQLHKHFFTLIKTYVCTNTHAGTGLLSLMFSCSQYPCQFSSLAVMFSLTPSSSLT